MVCPTYSIYKKKKKKAYKYVKENHFEKKKFCCFTKTSEEDISPTSSLIVTSMELIG
jgi:hypothetical protein